MDIIAWDELSIQKSFRADHLILYGSSIGCGCCSEGTSTEDPDIAIAIVEAYVKVKQDELYNWQKWLVEMYKNLGTLPAVILPYTDYADGNSDTC